MASELLVNLKSAEGHLDVLGPQRRVEGSLLQVLPEACPFLKLAIHPPQNIKRGETPASSEHLRLDFNVSGFRATLHPQTSCSGRIGPDSGTISC